MQLRRLIGLALVVVVLTGCAGQLRTGPQNMGNACDASLISGVLAPSPATGVGIRDLEGIVQPVLWPFGFSSRFDGTAVVLFDGTGQLIAREGDQIEAGGSAGADGIFVICPAESITVARRID